MNDNPNPQTNQVNFTGRIHLNPNINYDDIIIRTIRTLNIPDKKHIDDKMIDLAKSTLDVLFVQQYLIRIILLICFIIITYIIYVLFNQNIGLFILFIFLYGFFLGIALYFSGISNKVENFRNLLILKKY
jgi:hypothetical protein